MDNTGSFPNLLYMSDKKLSMLLALMISIASFGLFLNYFQGRALTNNESYAHYDESSSRNLQSLLNPANANEDNRFLESDIFTLFLRDLGGKVFEGTYELENDYELFEKKFGKIRINFSYSNYQSYSIFTIDYTILNGNYKEKWLSIVQEFNVNQYSTKSELKAAITEKLISLTCSQEKGAKITSKNLFKSVNKTASTVNSFYLNVTMPYFSEINGRIAMHNLPIDLSYKVNLKQNDSLNFERKLDNLGFILTTIAFINLYYTIVTIRDCLIQKINPKSFSPYLIMSDMIWNADLALCCLYLAMTQKAKFVDFSVCAFVFCVNFSIFEMRLLFLSYKSQDQFNNPEAQDQEMQKKKILRFYSILYGVVLVSLFYLYYIMLHSVLLFIVIIITFMPQIYHNAHVNILKNKIPTNAIVMFAINKLFIPLYIKLWPYNIIEAKPDYWFSFGSISILLFEVFILFLQAKLGGLFMIPKRCRKDYYNYFKSMNELVKANIDFEKATCAICLSLFELEKRSATNNNESLSSSHNSSSNNDSDAGSRPVAIVTNASDMTINISSSQIALDNNTKTTSNSNNIIVPNSNENNKRNNYNLIRRCCIKMQLKRQTTIRSIMLTPCNHYFHSECLNQWCTHKNECPICRTILPSLN